MSTWAVVSTTGEHEVTRKSVWRWKNKGPKRELWGVPTLRGRERKCAHQMQRECKVGGEAEGQGKGRQGVEPRTAPGAKQLIVK